MITFLVLSLVFSVALLLLAPKPNIENARASTLGDLQFPRASEGAPLPIVWGTVRLKAPNTIWYGNLTTVPITKKVETGLFSSKTITTGYKYYVTLDMALCLGPGVVLTKIWAGKYLIWSGSVSTETDITIDACDIFGGDEKGGGMSGIARFYPGTFSQNRDTHLAAVCNPDVPRYGGISHIVFKSFYIGTSSNLEPLNFELTRLTDGLAPGYGIMPNLLDANPFEIVYDATTSQWGRLGIDTALIDIPSWQAAAVTLHTEGNGMSFKAESSNTGKGLIEECLRQADGLLYQDPETGKIKAKLLRSDYVVSSLPVLDSSNVKGIDGFSKSTWDATYNQARVTFPNRERDYANSVASAQDFANINFQQRIRSTDVNFPGCTTAAVAAKLVAHVLSIYSVPLYKCTLRCTRFASTLRPGDVFVLNWLPYSMIGVVMRVQKVDLGSLTSGQVTVECIQDLFLDDTALFADSAPTIWAPIDLNPQQVLTRQAFETPNFILLAAGRSLGDNSALLYAVGKAPGTYSELFNVETSLDAFVTKYNSLNDAPYMGCGTLTVSYSATAGAVDRYDIATGITIGSIQNPTIISSYANRALITGGNTLAIIGNEIIAYRTFTDNLDGTYTLQGISRGFLDTLPEAHNIGDILYFIVGQEGLTETIFVDSVALQYRFIDTTATGSGDCGTPSVTSLTLDRRAFRPAPPAYLTLNASRTPPTATGTATVVAAWRERTRMATTLVWYDDATQTPEGGTTYRLRYRLNAGAWTTINGLTSPTYNVPVTTLVGTLDVEVYAVRNTLLSRIGDTLSIVLA